MYLYVIVVLYNIVKVEEWRFIKTDKKKIFKKVSLVLTLTFVVLGITGCFNSSNKIKKIDVNSDLVKSLYEKVNPSNDGDILTEFYGHPGELQNSYILITAIKMYIDEQKVKTVEEISQKDIENNIEKIFGKDVNYKHDTVYVKFDSYCMFRYNSDKNIYTLDGGCGGNTYEFFYRKITDAEETDKELFIYEKSIFVYDDWVGEGVDSHITIYNNIVDKNVIKKFDQDPTEQYSISLDDYLNEASTYKYIFEKNNDNYIFKGIELVK